MAITPKQLRDLKAGDEVTVKLDAQQAVMWHALKMNTISIKKAPEPVVSYHASGGDVLSEGFKKLEMLKYVYMGPYYRITLGENPTIERLDV